MDCPKQGEVMIFPGWIEDLNMESYEEVSSEVILNIKLRKSMAGFKYKVYKIKS